MLSKVKVQGKTVSEAITKGLRELNLRRDQVEVTVLEHPKKGFLGIGAKPAIVEVRKKRWVSDSLDSAIYMDVPHRRRGGNRRGRGPSRRSSRHSTSGALNNAAAGASRAPRVRTPKANEPQLLPRPEIQQALIPDNLKAPLQMAHDYVQNVLTHMGIKTENMHAWWDEKQQRILVTFDCDKPAIVIGKEGKTLEAIQYLATLAVTRQFDMPVSIVADTQNYWRKVEDKIDADIARAVDMLKQGNSVFRFRPMSSQLRRYIHRAVEGNEYVSTTSEGEGKWRKVTLRPTPKALEEARAGLAPADFVPGVIGEDLPPAASEQPQTPQPENAVLPSKPQDTPAQPDGEAPNTVTQEETPTQKIVSQTSATTVSQTVSEGPSHKVVETAVIVTTETQSK